MNEIITLDFTFRMDFFDRIIEVDDKTELVISQAYVSDVGGVVWDAALVLNAYIGTLECKDKTFIELGAGTGVSGLETRSDIFRTS